MLIIFFTTCYSTYAILLVTQNLINLMFLVYSRWMQPILQLNVQSRRSMISRKFFYNFFLYVWGGGADYLCNCIYCCNFFFLASNVQHPAAYNLASSTPLNRTYNSQITRLSPTSPICTNKTNCTCGKNPEPVYGDVSTFALSSPELRRNRRFL